MAGRKTIIGPRLKQSGMRWTVKSANAIIALRCCELSGCWEEFWEARAVGWVLGPTNLSHILLLFMLSFHCVWYYLLEV